MPESRCWSDWFSLHPQASRWRSTAVCCIVLKRDTKDELVLHLLAFPSDRRWGTMS